MTSSASSFFLLLTSNAANYYTKLQLVREQGVLPHFLDLFQNGG